MLRIAGTLASSAPDPKLVVGQFKSCLQGLYAGGGELLRSKEVLLRWWKKSYLKWILDPGRAKSKLSISNTPPGPQRSKRCINF